MPELMSEWLSLPQIVLTERQLFDLELLGNGGFAPLEGFLSEGDYSSVVEDMHLMDGSLWPIPIVLDIRSPHHYTIGQRVLLVDTYGNALAVFSIKSIYTPDREREAQMVYGTTDRMHPGARYILDEQGDVNLGGTIEMIAPPQHFDFKELRHTPEELKAFFKEKGWDKIVAFQTRNPLHRAHVEIIKRAAEMHDAHILLHPVVGLTKEGDIDYITRVRAYKALQENGRLGDDATLALLPLAMRMAGPREALLHALVRRNYGATHFIVGRDHAGPGLGSDGEPLYGPYEAQELALKYQPELGITIVPAQETVYVENEDRYLATPELEPHHVVKNISGTELRRMLRNNEEIPDWFSFPEVIAELRRGAMRQTRRGGITVFFTGLPSSGKSTIARILHHRLLEVQDRPATLLDGDVVRRHLSRGLGFSRTDRNLNIERIGYVAGEITKHGGIALCAAIAPYTESRDANRALIGRDGAYVEVYVATPLAVCRMRDPKGLYKKAELGLISGVTGVDDPYEVPTDPELTFDLSDMTGAAAAEAVITYLADRGLIMLV